MSLRAFESSSVIGGTPRTPSIQSHHSTSPIASTDNIYTCSNMNISLEFIHLHTDIELVYVVATVDKVL